MKTMGQSLSRVIIRNTAFNAAGRFWALLTAVLLTPYIIGRIGVEGYGIWAIVGVLTGYFGLLDLGVKTSFVKYIAEFHAKGLQGKIAELVNTGFVFYAAFALITVVPAYFLADPLVSFLGIPSRLHEEAVFVFVLGFILFGLSNAMSPFGAVQNGLQRMDISNKLSIALSIPYIGGTLFFLESGYGLRGLMINQAVNLCLSGALNVIVSFKLLPELRFNPLLFSGEMFRKLFNYGYKLQISNFSNLVSFQTDKLLITYFLGVGLVTFYQLGTSILQAVRQFCLILVSSITPAASEIEAGKGKHSLNELYVRGSKYLIFVSVPLTLFAVSDASLILAAWMGLGYDQAVPVLQILAVGYFSATVTGVASAITAGVAKTEYDMKFGIFLAILNLSLGIIMAVKVGFLGVVSASAFSLLAASFLYLSLFHGYMGTPMKEFLVLFYKPAAAGIVPAAVILVLNRYAWADIARQGRLSSLGLLFVQVLLFAALYLASIRMLKFFDEFDLGLFKTRIPWFARILGAEI